MTDHRITPPPELVEQWMQAHSTKYDLARHAARWGANQELEACCRWLPKLPPWSANDLRKHRRPNPPSLKEQALAVLTQYMTGETILTKDSVDTIYRALEALDD
jgi:hypothetical protein